ncbi:autophagy- protein 2 [Haplosporangium sp. Z 767]|nr:autophagy- protein 2 [Haplosporangium sp. Z 767]
MKAWSLGNFFSSLAVPAGLQKRLVSFLLQRAIGRFLEDDLNLEKLDIELSNGIVHLTDLRLNARVLNELAAGTPLAVTQGRIGSITATIPWRNLWNGQCVLEIDGIDITLAPIQAHSGHFSSKEDQILSSSVDLASDFLHQQSLGKEEAALQESLLQTFQTQTPQAPSGFPGDFNARSNPSSSSTASAEAPEEDGSEASDGEGVQFVAKLIEKLMARIQVICKGTVIRLRHSSTLPLVKDMLKSNAQSEKLDYELEVRLPYIAYRDETPGWDQSATGMDASSIRSTSSGHGSESASSSVMLEESVIPSVIWQDTPESIKTVVFKGFSIWIKQKGAAKEDVVTQTQFAGKAAAEDGQIQSDDQDLSDSDTDVFSDAQENLTPSMMASHIYTGSTFAPKTTPPQPEPTPAVQESQLSLYEAEILSTLRHKNRVKVNVRKNATVVPGSVPPQEQSTVKSLLDIDFHMRSIFIALSPSQMAFILEILALMENAPSMDISSNQKHPMEATDRATTAKGGQGTTREHSGNIGQGLPRDNAGYYEQPLRPDSVGDHPPSLHNHNPLSPKRSELLNHQRVPFNGSPGGRPLDQERYLDSRNHRGTIPIPAVYLDSSRFLSGSTYGDSRASSSSSSISGTSSNVHPALTVKLKGRITTFQMFVLYQDPASQQKVPTEAGFFKNPAPQSLGADHLKLELDSMLLKYQQWTSTTSSGGGQRAAKTTKGQVDFTLSNFSISEWINSEPKAFDSNLWSHRSDQYRTAPRKEYIPLVEFDADQEPLFQSTPTSKFSTLQVPVRYLTERGIASRTKRAKHQQESAKLSTPSSADPRLTGKDTTATGMKEVVRMRVILGGKKDGSRPNTPSSDTTSTTSSSSYARDVTIEIKPMQVHVDLYTFQRLESCLLAVMCPVETKRGQPSDQAKEHPQLSTEQQIMDDLDSPQKANKAIWVSVPDMALTLTGQKDTGPEFRSIYDVIAVNVSKLVLTQSSDMSKGASHGHDGRDSAPSNSSEDHVSKMKVDFANVSAFVIPAHSTTSKAFLSIGSLPSHPAPLSGFHSAVPNIEITTRLPKSLPVHYDRPSPPGFPRVPALQAFAILEGEENVLNSTDEEEELLFFKQRTMETSLWVVNTHFPLIAVHLEKRILDILQLRVNDLGTWLTLFSEQLAVKMLTIPESPTANEACSQDKFSHVNLEFAETKDSPRCSLDEDSRDDQSEHGTDRSTAYGEELRQQAEGKTSAPRNRATHEQQFQPRLVKPTMASVLIFAQTVDVILDYPSGPTVLDPVPIVKSYQIIAGEARIFAAAKYQGGMDTYVSVDTEDLDFWEITAQKPKALLLTRAIPKSIKLKTPKPMFHMTSLLSFDPVLKFKENDTKLEFAGLSWKFSTEQTAVDDVQDFFAEPIGIVYLNPPHQCTRINVSLSECGMDYKPLHIHPRFVLTFEKMKVFATLIPESPTLKSKVQIYNMNLFLIDHPQSIQSPQHPSIGSSSPGIESRQFWRSLGFAMIGQCPFFELNSIKSKNGQLPLYDLMITNQIFYLETCSDSFETLMQLASYMGDNGDMPIEKKKILERLAEAERAANRAKSNVVYQDMLVASLDEDAFRKPKPDRNQEDSGALDIVEGFYSVECDDSENDLFKVQIQDTPDVDGFHEVYADLLVGPHRTDPSASGVAKDGHRHQIPLTKDKGSKSKSRAYTMPSVKATKEAGRIAPPHGVSKQSSSSTRLSLDGGGREGHYRNDNHARTESLSEHIFRILDHEAKFTVIEDYFSIPILTKEERARDEGTLAKLRLRVRDFNFSWRLYDGFDWEISRLDEAERKKQARQLANRLYDPNDIIHSTMETPQSNLEASIFERLSGMQPSLGDRQEASVSSHNRRDLSPSPSEADSTSDYQNDMMSQASGTGGRFSSGTSVSGSRRGQQHQRLRRRSSTSRSDAPKQKNKLERSKVSMIEFNADKVRVDFEDYVDGVETASHLSLRVKEFEIIDNLKSSLWHKFLSHQRPESNMATPRQTQSNMIRIDLDGVRPVVSASTVEFRLKAKILPLRLYIDQDALIFLIRFFVQGTGGGATAPMHEMPSEGATAGSDEREKKKSNDMYFQSVRLGEIAVKMDYKPKHVDYTGLSGGNFVELMNFFHLDAAEMTLQEVELHGINGFAKLAQDLVAAWLPHIRSTQVPHMVSGLTPIRSLVNLGSGIADLVLLPIEQYKKDGHIIRGLQKGGQAFTRATTLEALKIGTKLAVGTQVLLEHADEIFGSGTVAATGSSSSDKDHQCAGDDVDDGLDSHPGKRVVATMVSDSEAYMQESIDDGDQLLYHLQQQQQQRLSSGQDSGSSSSPTGKAHKVSKYANQPADINEGMELAYKSLSKNIGTAAHTIFAVPMEVYERAGAQGSVRAVIRAVPVAVLKPMIGATEAFSKVLIGIRNSIDPVQRLQMEDKYKKQ